MVLPIQMHLSVGVLGREEVTSPQEEITRAEACCAFGSAIGCGLALGSKWVRRNSGGLLPTAQMGEVAREGNVNGFTADCF
jgi:hypothetical protein